jgi:hypothetical protein
MAIIGNRKWERVNGGITKPIPEVTNKQFATTNQHFINECSKVEVKPTSRQASKFRNKKGKAFIG